MARLTKIYTRSGDAGRTGLVGGKRVAKDAPRIEVLGAIDELNAAIGLARAFNRHRKLDAPLLQIQQELFHLGAELAMVKPVRTGQPQIAQANVAVLERLLDESNAVLGPLREFILPDGSPCAAALHVARTICRRAERRCVHLARTEKLGEFVVPYLNRLGDALFNLARLANRQARVRETFWQTPPVTTRRASRRTGP